MQACRTTATYLGKYGFRYHRISMLLGCIGDDFTGSSDLANTLRKQGMQAVQYCGVPQAPATATVEAGIVALKSRSIPVEEAVRDSLEALAWLQTQGCTQFLFKYCSTFDSTPNGNIGPVLQALSEQLKADRVIVCPAFPGTGRSVYQGHLFVGDTLLNESGMQNHPVTPMTDADLRRWLALQTSMPVGHVASKHVLAGADAIHRALQDQHDDGKRAIVVDAIQDSDLISIGAAAADLPLLSGGSGIAMGLPANFRTSGKLASSQQQWRGECGPCVALSGSCSITTRQQLKIHQQQCPGFELLAADVINERISATELAKWAMKHCRQNASAVPVIYSSADPDAVAAVQAEFGAETSASALEQFFATLASALVTAGVQRLLLAGGETAGAVVQGLALEQLQIGPEIDPGVPAMRATDSLVLALKSGNFGAADFFQKGATVLANGE